MLDCIDLLSLSIYTYMCVCEHMDGYSELLGFWTLSIVRYSRSWKTQRFGN
jgi:hypothetical protein